MNHRMAVRAQRDQLSDRIYQISFPQRSQGSDVVNVDESFAVLTIRFLKIETTAFAHGTVIANTGLTGFRVPLVGTLFRPFDVAVG